MLTPLQITLARTALRMTLDDFAKGIGVSRPTLSNYENGHEMPASRMAEILKFCEEKGLEFTEGEGVRFRTIPVQRYKSTEGFRTFMDDVYETAKNEGGEIVLFNGFPDMLTKYLGQDWYKMHAKRMEKVKDNFEFKVTMMNFDAKQIGKGFAEYRYFPMELESKDTIYVYGAKTAFLSFGEDVSIISIDLAGISNAFRELFNIAWGGKAQPI